MGQPLDTSVKGSPGTCTAMADWLGNFAKAAHNAANTIRGTRGESETGWVGPAGDGFRSDISKVDSDADTLGTHATKIAGALNDFAGALTSIHGKMTNAVTDAHGAGLTVNGPYIYPPDPPGPAPVPPMGPFTPAEAQEVAQHNASAGAAYQQTVSAYNAKVKAFNNCKSIVDSARQQETQAHKDLEESLAKSDSVLNELVTIGSAVTSRMLDFIKSTHDAGSELLEKAAEETKAGAFYEQFNKGNLISLTPEEQDLVNWGKQRSGALSDEYTAKATQLEAYVGHMPPALQQLIAANPGTLLKDGSQFLKYTQSVVREMPYLGTVVNAASQSVQALDGEKSWGRASADFAADTIGSAVGSAAGGALVGAIAGSEVPVVGTIIGGVAGAFLGSAAADKLVDIIANPTEFDDKAVQNFQNMNLGTNNALNYPG